MSQNKENVIKFTQVLLLDELPKTVLTAGLISRTMDRVLLFNPSWEQDLDREAVIDELIQRFSVWVGKDTMLSDNADHVHWLTPERKKDRPYWQRYREWLEGSLSYKAVEALDRSTDTVLELLEDPRRQGVWDRRGLVVGHVQSGKTGNYTGLICKAADAGYKIIIVLAGLHNNLRAQTQIRLEEGFLGYDTNRDTNHKESGIGAGQGGYLADKRPNCATNRTEKGDFNTRVAKHLAITPETRPWLFVVKKNKTVLTRLLEWIRNHVGDSQETGTNRRIVTKLPLLIIDDEADHASVDTGEQVFDETGKPDEEHQPTAINRLIRKILISFTRSAYVGYTATPFANIFIHDQGETKEEGPDLFPSAFIINLAAHSNYIGPAKLFGSFSSDGRKGALPLIRIIRDHDTSNDAGGWMPVKHKNGHRPRYDGRDQLPPSLVQAIDAFILACSIRRLRGQGRDHSSMLIHVTRFNSVQKEVHEQVAGHVRHLKQRIQRRLDHQEILGRLRELWENDFLPTSDKIREDHPTHVPEKNHEWESIVEVLSDTLDEIDIRIINGTARDALDYTDAGEYGLKLIAIGGDKLARGLTLEGLCVSYFLRASKMYDTLMQMGRWFGYRSGYLDLSRLYTTNELFEWFGHITDASEELREEFDQMAASKATPKEFGLKVQSHPILLVTSRLKMRSAKTLFLAFSGQLLETVCFHLDPKVLSSNLEALNSFVSHLGAPEENPIRIRQGTRHKWEGYLWENVPASEVIWFLQSYQTHPSSYKVNSNLIVDFITRMNTNGELTDWTVALIGGGEGKSRVVGDRLNVSMLGRKAKSVGEGYYSIGRLLSPRDESIDLDEAAWVAALQATQSAWNPDAGRSNVDESPDLTVTSDEPTPPKSPSGVAIRKIRGEGAEGISPHPERGLLLLYLLDPHLGQSEVLKNLPPVAAFGVSFPGSTSGIKVEYKINNILWEQEYGPAD